MAKFRFTIDSILRGQNPTKYFGSKGGFETSLGIDPDQPADGNATMVKAGGVITPIGYADFSGANLTAAAMWLITTFKTALAYVYAVNGRFLSYSSTFGSETLITTPASGEGNGAAYYNNYIYLATPTQVFRYGPLGAGDGGAAISNALIANSELLDGWDGGVDTVLTNTTYPSAGGILYPNHTMHVHVDNILYVCDYINGRGLIHKIKTTKTTVEGDTNDGSDYNVLALPFGYKPVALASYGIDLAILAFKTESTTLSQGGSALFLWDTLSTSSFYRQVDIPGLATAILNENGRLHIWTGNTIAGYEVSRFDGGYGLIPEHFSEEGRSPFPGAVDALGSRLSWGHNTTYPENSASILSMGYKTPKLPRDAIHNIIRTASAGTTPVVTAAKYLEQASGIVPRMIVAWKDASDFGIDRVLGSATLNSLYRSETFNVGERFQITKITLNLALAVAANQTITPKILVDDDSTTFDDDEKLTIINNTNYTASERKVVLYPQGVEGQHNFNLQLKFTGTAMNSVLLPILVEGETLDD